jgi:hypothetical protein
MQTLLDQLLEELTAAKAVVPARATNKTFLPLGAILEPDATKNVSREQLGTLARKHTVTGTTNELGRPLNEGAFFQDCELEAPIVNLTITPMHTLLNMIPNRSTAVDSLKVGFVTGVNDTVTGTQQDEPCDEPQIVGTDFSFCKVRLPLGRRQIKTKTGEIDGLIRKACDRLYDDFYFVGDVRGVSATPSLRFTPDDRDLIVEGALMRDMKGKGRVFSRWMQRLLWQGDPANNTAGGGYKEFVGLDMLLTDDYPTDMAAYIEGSTAVGDCALLGADVKDFANNCIGGGVLSLWDIMQEADHTVMLRESYSGVNRGGLLIVMHPVMFKAFKETIPCEMVGNGCAGAVINANDGGNGLFNLAERQRIEQSRQITINGNVYDIVFDDAIAISEVSPGVYTSKIYGLPLTLNSEQVFYTENVNYTEYMAVLRPVDGVWNESVGWSDGGHFLHTVERKNLCFEVTTKIEPRLVFKASRFSWVIENIRACYAQSKPIPTV